MPSMIKGVVRDGRIVPDSSIPEGTAVEIRVAETLPDIPSDLAAEFDAWNLASDRALDLFEASSPFG